MSPKKRTGDRLKLLQERAVHQYFQPWLTANGSAFNVASNVDSIAVQDLQELGYSPQRSRDKALASFAQLAALRLNVRRAMVSLIDSHHQYILIEATRTQAFETDDHSDSGDGLWMGTSIIKREEAVSYHCFSSTYSVPDKNGKVYTARALVVNDCLADERFKDRSYVRAKHGVRFYAGVPIVTRDGHAIGSYAVFDETPRDGLSAEEIKYMQHVALAIMEHLEWAKDRVDRYKGDRISRGLASFIARTAPASRPSRAGWNIGMNGTDDHVSRVESSSVDRAHTDVRKDFAIEFAPDKRVAIHNDGEMYSDTESDIDSADDGNSADANSRSKIQHENLQHLLTRAARSLRRSTLADGVIFFEALEHAVIDQHSELLEAADAVDIPEPTGHQSVLSVSLRTRSEEPAAAESTITRNALAAYFRHYPHGKCFHFTAQGTAVDSDEDEEVDDGTNGATPGDNAKIGSKRKRDEAKPDRISHDEVLGKLKGVRELIFLPLRDFLNGKWIAGAFLWSNTFGRMMDMGPDMPLLDAFANGIASEVLRMNVEQLSRSKTAFIASMSHELRSPLHGILGSVEFLNDTKTSSYQGGLISSIAKCSRTLLDTLSNLLSYAKVSQTQASAATSKADLALLVEEVVEAVCAGHVFRRDHTAAITAMPQHNSPDILQHAFSSPRRAQLSQLSTINHPKERGDVSVVLDIAFSDNWQTLTNPGAFRRVVMNLVGNALKYTAQGFISISLRFQNKNGDAEIVLKVADSGKGISGSFLKNNLFVAFKQEDAFASGTGLGLSIVKQLVESLDGTIAVQSILGKGSEFQVNLPVRTDETVQDTNGDDTGEEDHDVVAVSHVTRGKKVLVIDMNKEGSAAKLAGQKRLKRSIADICGSWFGMEVARSSLAEVSGTDVLILIRPVLVTGSIPARTRESQTAPKVIVVISPSAAESVKVIDGDSTGLVGLGYIVEVVSQPCGPRKLASALRRGFERFDEVDTAVASTEAIPELTSIPPAEIPVPALTHDDTASTGLGINDPRTPAQDPLPAPDQRRVLIVDDNVVNVELMARFVRKSGFPYEQASDGAAAVERFQAALSSGTPFDCVFMDVSMPVMDGLEASRRMRMLEAEAGVKRSRIIALTGFEGEDTQRRAEEVGVDVFLSKPVRFAKLREILEEEDLK